MRVEKTANIDIMCRNCKALTQKSATCTANCGLLSSICIGSAAAADTHCMQGATEHEACRPYAGGNLKA